MQEDPGRSLHFRQGRGQPLRHAKPAELPGCWRLHGRDGAAGPVDDRHRHGLGDPLPVLPMVKPRQIVGAHDPDQRDGAKPCLQPKDRIRCKAAADFGFDARDGYSTAFGQSPGFGDPSGDIAAWRRRFERIAGRDQPPHSVESQAVPRGFACRDVTPVGRVEGPAEQTDPGARIMMGKRESRGHSRGQSRPPAAASNSAIHSSAASSISCPTSGVSIRAASCATANSGPPACWPERM